MLKGNNYICSLKLITMIFTRFFLFAFYLVLGVSNFAQTVLINENFDSGDLTGWTIIDGDMAPVNNDPQVAQLPNSFHLVVDYDSTNTNDSLLAATSWFSDTSLASNFLISPIINFTNTGNYVNFQAFSVDGSYPEGLQIFYSFSTDIDSLMNFPALFDTIAIPSNCTNFQVNIDSVPLNTNLHLVFRHYANDQYILALDNINVITGDLSSLESANTNLLKIYPNPSSGNINIDGISENSLLTIYNTIGRIVWKGNSKDHLRLNFSKGLYFIKYDGNNYPFIIK